MENAPEEETGDEEVMGGNGAKDRNVEKDGNGCG